jgi:uncharacterized iron-regulated membrane protein
VAAAKRARPGEHVQFVSADPEEPDVWAISMGRTQNSPPAENKLVLADARTAAVLQAPDLMKRFSYIMLRLHADLFAGLPGTLFLGAMGLLFVVAIVSGVVVYGPFMRRNEFGTVRMGSATRVKWLDLHNLIGIVTLGWATVVGITGVINALATPMFKLWQFTELAAMTAPYRGSPAPHSIAPLQRAFDAALAAEPGMRPGVIAFPGTDFAGAHHYAIFMRGSTPLTARLYKPVLIDAQTAVVSGKRDMPWYLTMLFVSQPLHFGDYGGMSMKIIWGLMTLATIIVLGSGLYLWLKKRNVSIEPELAGAEPSMPSAACVPSTTQGEGAKA